jgi:calcineurin-like phosphoesterase family protein
MKVEPFETGASMRTGHRARMAWRTGHRKPAGHLILARVPDKGIASLIASFPEITGCSSGTSREPHVTLFGPFLPDGDARDLPGILDQALERATHLSCRRTDLIRLKGVKGGAIAFDLDPGNGMRALYQTLVISLTSRVSWCTWIDRPPGQRRFHITLRFNIPFRELPGVWEKVTRLPESPLYIRTRGKDPGFPLRTYLRTCDTPIDLFRVTIMRRGFLLKEYDLPRQLWLSRGEALGSGGWVQTKEAYRKREGLELTGTSPRKRESPFVIADLHLGHRNIIDYCRRPFSSSQEMDRVLIGNWNYTVRPGDEIYHLGDLRYGRNAHGATHYLDQFTGIIRLVPGNHDEVMPGAVHDLRLTYEGIPFLMIHDPEEARVGKGTWVLHGHHHNNHIALYPFINTENRTINVSAELVNYAPVSLAEICGFIRRAKPGEHIPTLKEARERYPAQEESGVRK